MKSEIWIRYQLEEVQQLQRAITVQQNNIEEALKKVKRESLGIIDMLNEIEMAAGNTVTAELEAAVKAVRARAISIDRKVSDCKSSEQTTTKGN